MQLPLNKIPTFEFLSLLTIAYTGDFQCELKAPILFGELNVDGQTYNLGNSISNANQHNFNSSFRHAKTVPLLGCKKIELKAIFKRTIFACTGFNTSNDENSSERNSKKKFKLKDVGIGLLTSINRMQLNYAENNSSFLPGYLPTPGAIGTMTTNFGIHAMEAKEMSVISLLKMAGLQPLISSINNTPRHT